MITEVRGTHLDLRNTDDIVVKSASADLFLLPLVESMAYKHAHCPSDSYDLCHTSNNKDEEYIYSGYRHMFIYNESAQPTAYEDLCSINIINARIMSGIYESICGSYSVEENLFHIQNFERLLSLFMGPLNPAINERNYHSFLVPILGIVKGQLLSSSDINGEVLAKCMRESTLRIENCRHLISGSETIKVASLINDDYNEFSYILYTGLYAFIGHTVQMMCMPYIHHGRKSITLINQKSHIGRGDIKYRHNGVEIIGLKEPRPVIISRTLKIVETDYDFRGVMQKKNDILEGEEAYNPRNHGVIVRSWTDDSAMPGLIISPTRSSMDSKITTDVSLLNRVRDALRQVYNYLPEQISHTKAKKHSKSLCTSMHKALARLNIHQEAYSQKINNYAQAPDSAYSEYMPYHYTSHSRSTASSTSRSNTKSTHRRDSQGLIATPVDTMRIRQSHHYPNEYDEPLKEEPTVPTTRQRVCTPHTKVLRKNKRTTNTDGNITVKTTFNYIVGDEGNNVHTKPISKDSKIPHKGRFTFSREYQGSTNLPQIRK